MKFNHLKLFTGITLAAFLLNNCSNNNQNAENKNGLMLDSSSNTSAYKFEDVIKMQDSLLTIFSWPAKHEIDLNDDGINEVFLAIEGYSRGMGYILFCKEGNNWKLISDEESIPSGHLGINKLDKMMGGWHDFVALQPSGREGIIESYYAWDGKIYILKDQKEIEN